MAAQIPSNWLIFLLLMHLIHSNMGDNNTQCGITDVMPSEAKHAGLFIVGGKPAAPRMFPWVGYLSFDSADRPQCTVSLISAKFAVTASHCIVQKCPQTTFAVFGIRDIKGAEKKYIYKSVRFLHPKVQTIREKGMTLYINDIALIELEKEVDIRGSKGAIKLLCLPSPPIQVTGQLFLAGWGATSFDVLKPSDQLKYMVSNIMNKTSCEGFKSKFCVKGIKEKETPYKGDSGGPAMKLIEGRYYLYGVLHGKDKSNTKYRSFYTNVSEFLDWIKRHPEKDTQEVTCPYKS